MKTTFHLSYCGDLFEVCLDGYVIARITRYFDGSGRRQDVQYDDLPEALKLKVLDRVEEAINRLSNG